jgi:hypothetical protein
MPVRPEPSWRVADYSADGPYRGFEDFTKVVCTQIADLLAFEEDPPGPFASLGSTRRPGSTAAGPRSPRWCNFDPPDVPGVRRGRRVRRLERGGRPPGAYRINATPNRSANGRLVGRGTSGRWKPITWGDVAAFLEYGQSYE